MISCQNLLATPSSGRRAVQFQLNFQHKRPPGIPLRRANCLPGRCQGCPAEQKSLTDTVSRLEPCIKAKRMGSSPFRACQEKAGPSPQALHSDGDSSYHTRSPGLGNALLPLLGEGLGGPQPRFPSSFLFAPGARTSVTDSVMSRGNRSDLRSLERRWQLSPTANRAQ